MARYVKLSATDCRYCEACWLEPVDVARKKADGTRDLLCDGCAAANYSRRVDIFPPFGIYGLTERKIASGR